MNTTGIAIGDKVCFKKNPEAFGIVEKSYGAVFTIRQTHLPKRHGVSGRCYPVLIGRRANIQKVAG